MRMQSSSESGRVAYWLPIGMGHVVQQKYTDLNVRLIDLKYLVSVVALSSWKKPEGFRAKIFHATAWSILPHLQMVHRFLGDEMH